MPDGRLLRPPASVGLKRFRAGWSRFLAATVIALYLCWLMLRPFVEVLIWAGVLVIVFFPFYEALLRRSHKPTVSALLSCAFVVGVIVIPLTLLTVVIVREAGDAAQYLNNNWNHLLDPERRQVQWVEHYVVPLDRLRTKEGIQQGILEAMKAFGVDIATTTGVVVANVLVTGLKIVFVVFTMFYLFRDSDRVQATLRNMLPLDAAQATRIFGRTREVINASVHGVMVIAVIQGFMGGFAFWVLGLSSPLLWGSIMTLLSMIPLVGSTVVWIPTTLWLFATGHPIKAILLAAWGGAAISSVDNFLRPRLVGGKTRLHELLVFFSVVGGLQVFGVLGIVIGPVLVAITLALMDVFRQADRPSAAAIADAQATLRELPVEAATPVEREAGVS